MSSFPFVYSDPSDVKQYYLQYQNRKAEYFSAIWDVINWRAAEQRFSE